MRQQAEVIKQPANDYRNYVYTCTHLHLYALTLMRTCAYLHTCNHTYIQAKSDTSTRLVDVSVDEKKVVVDEKKVVVTYLETWIACTDTHIRCVLADM